MRVVIVVPAFSKRQQSHPPAVGGQVARGKAPRSPGMRRRIHQPGRVQQEHRAEEHSPQEPWQAAYGKKNDAENDLRNVVIFRKPDVELVFGQVRNVASQGRSIVMHRLSHQDPAHMRPPLSING